MPLPIILEIGADYKDPTSCKEIEICVYIFLTYCLPVCDIHKFYLVPGGASLLALLKKGYLSTLLASKGFLESTIAIGKHKIKVLHLGVGLVIGGGLFYYTIRNKRPTGVAPDVTFMLNPPEIMPNTPTHLAGMFHDGKGTPVRVNAGYFYIFAMYPNGMKMLAGQGTLGNNISHFNVPINTSGLKQGLDYSLVVTDMPLSQQEIMGPPMGIMPGAMMMPGVMTPTARM